MTINKGTRVETTIQVEHISEHLWQLWMFVKDTRNVERVAIHEGELEGSLFIVSTMDYGDKALMHKNKAQEVSLVLLVTCRVGVRQASVSKQVGADHCQ